MNMYLVPSWVFSKFFFRGKYLSPISSCCNISRSYARGVNGRPTSNQQQPSCYLQQSVQPPFQRILFARQNLAHCNCVNFRTKRCNSTEPYYDFSVIVGIQKIFENVHMYTHLPWWSVIIISTIALRTMITLPLARKQAFLLAQIELLKPTVDQLSEALKHNLAAKGKREGKTAKEVNKQFQKELRKYTYDLYKQNKCNPIKLFVLPWVQLPLWISISLALRNLSGFYPKSKLDNLDENIDRSNLGATGIESEGMLWFTNLSIPDPTWILPVVLGLTNLANIELNALRKKDPTSRERILTTTFRLLSLTMIVVATQVPSGMALYWVTSSTFGLVQNAVIRAPKVRRFLKIPKTVSESKTPYQDILAIGRRRIEAFIKIQRK